MDDDVFDERELREDADVFRTGLGDGVRPLLDAEPGFRQSGAIWPDLPHKKHVTEFVFPFSLPR